MLDGLRTVNTDKILWENLMPTGLAIVVNGMLDVIEKRIGENYSCREYHIY